MSYKLQSKVFWKLLNTAHTALNWEDQEFKADLEETISRTRTYC